MENKNVLMIPIWLLYNVDSIEEINYDSILSDTLKDSYDLEVTKKIYKTIKLAEEKPDYPFNEIMDKAPVLEKINFKDEEIYSHLMNFKSFMEDERFGLLTDTRKPK
ncbi:hypothetical protein [Pontimicrobium sp. MEBiC01747]